MNDWLVGAYRATDVVRRFAHETFGRPHTILQVVIRRYRGRVHVWRQCTASAAAPRLKLTNSSLRWALEAVVVQKLTVARVADELNVRWNTADDAILAEGRRVLISDPARFDAVTVLRVDEHVW